MSDNAPSLPQLPGSGATPADPDKGWIAAIVDRLVPKFQSGGVASSADPAMQTDDAGK
ncbi:hypothetical protein PtB15_6B593 [Puccinia triticina]|nr:hypothetical protein PtB15_6B593 [Puccinia triticina]